MNTKRKTEGDTILKVDVLGRVRTPRERRERILDAFEQSGMPGTRFAREHGINCQTFATWIQRRRRERGECGRPAGRRETGRGTSSGTLTLAEILMPDEKPEPAAAVRVELPGGASLTVTDASQAAVAAELIRRLSARPLPC